MTPRTSRWQALLGLAALVVSSTAPRAAERVEFTDGRTFTVADYRTLGSKARLALKSGSVFTVPLASIRRVTAVSAPERRPEAAATWTGSDVTVGGNRRDLRLLAHRIARRHGVDPHLVEAMIDVESGFDPWAVSPKGASGLLQLMPHTALRFGLGARDIFDPKRNIEAGVAYVKWLWRLFDGDRTRVLAAYNAGENVVARHGGIPPYRETRRYVSKVLAELEVRRGRTKMIR